MNKHYNIPIFIPELACPNQCVYCNQRHISGSIKSPSIDEVNSIIKKYLDTLDTQNNYVEIAFFGGNFTGLDTDMQIAYLECAYKYLEKGLAKSIRLSTRPDYINQENLKILQKYGVKTIELGIQSTDIEVLKATHRGYNNETIIKATQIIKKNNFCLGLQMMIGLPEDNYSKSIKTAKDIIALYPNCVRIYPTLIIKDTELQIMHKKGLYKPLSLIKAIITCKDLTLLFENNNIPIIKMGLHPTEGLVNKTNFIDGPFHISFRELVYTAIWHDIFKHKLISQKESNKKIIIEVPNNELNYAIGYKAYNKQYLSKKFKKVFFKINNNLQNRELNVCYY